VRSPEHPSAQIAAGATRDRAREMRPAPSARRARRATGSAGACGRGIVVPKPEVLENRVEVRSDEQQEKSNRLIIHHRDAALSRARAPLHRRELSSKARRYARFTTIAISSRGSIVVSGSRAARGAPASPAWLRTLDCPSVTHPIPSSRAFQSASPSRSPRLLSPVSSARSRFVSRSPARRAEVDGVAGPGRRARRARVRGSAAPRRWRARAKNTRSSRPAMETRAANDACARPRTLSSPRPRRASRGRRGGRRGRGASPRAPRVRARPGLRRVLRAAAAARARAESRARRRARRPRRRAAPAAASAAARAEQAAAGARAGGDMGAARLRADADADADAGVRPGSLLRRRSCAVSASSRRGTTSPA
jgi:hypothetical protein